MLLDSVLASRKVLAGLAALVLVFVSFSHPSAHETLRQSKHGVARWVVRSTSSAGALIHQGGRQLPNCRVADLLDDETVRRYGSNAVKLSRGYEGTGTLVKRVLERARAGLPVRLAAVGGSVSFGHALLPPLTADNHMYHRVLDWFKTEFPGVEHTLDLSGALPAVSNVYLGYCAREHIDTDNVDLLFVEMDVNSLPLTEHDSITGTEAVYRTLRDLPSRPAIISVSALGLVHDDLSVGWVNSLAATQWFDVPLISLRNWLIPHLAQHPEQAALWYKDHAGIFDDRHMNQRGHVAMGDLLVLYLREQLCELDRTFQFRRLLVEHTSPTDEAIPDSYINTLTVPLGLQERWTSEANTRGPLSPRCRSVVSKKDPLVPKHNHGWDLIKRNDKVAWEAEEPGSSITFDITTVSGEVGLWVWQTEDKAYGAAQCSVRLSNGTDLPPVLVHGFRPPGLKPVAIFDWGGQIATDLPPGEHTVSCRNERSPEAPDDAGARFRISATLSR